VSVRVEGERVAHSSGFEWLARAGFIARGVIYVLVGVLAVKVATGHAGTTPDQKGALETIAHQPFGQVLLILVALGLGGYALWRMTRALLGHGPEDSDRGFDRVAAFASGVVYAGLCALAVEIVSGSSSSGSESAGGVLGWPGGTLLVGIAGMIVTLGVLGLSFRISNPSGQLAWIAVICLMGYVASFAISLGPIFWLLIAEIYPLKIRGLAEGTAATFNWGSNLIVSLTFLTLVEKLGASSTFLLYAFASVASWLFAYYLVPETKGRTLEEIEAFWGARPRSL